MHPLVMSKTVNLTLGLYFYNCVEPTEADRRTILGHDFAHANEPHRRHNQYEADAIEHVGVVWSARGSGSILREKEKTLANGNRILGREITQNDSLWVLRLGESQAPIHSIIKDEKFDILNYMLNVKITPTVVHALIRAKPVVDAYVREAVKRYSKKWTIRDVVDKPTSP